MSASDRSSVLKGNNVWLRRVATHFEILQRHVLVDRGPPGPLITYEADLEVRGPEERVTRRRAWSARASGRSRGARGPPAPACAPCRAALPRSAGTGRN